MKIKKYFLVMISVSVCCLALLYGVNPRWFARSFFGVTALDINLAHILRAIMGLYIALGIFWFASAFNDRSRDVAILTVLVFGAGLLCGRIVSLAADGMPSLLLQAYFVLELCFVPLTYWVYRRPD